MKPIDPELPKRLRAIPRIMFGTQVSQTLDEAADAIEALLAERERLREVASWAQAVLTALNAGNVHSCSPLHIKLREVMIAYREQSAIAEPEPVPPKPPMPEQVTIGGVTSIVCDRCHGNGRVELLEHCPVCRGFGTTAMFVETVSRHAMNQQEAATPRKT